MEEPARIEGPEATADDGEQPPIIALSHLRWNFVYQRPQHLLSRAAASRTVFFVEEPVYGDDATQLVERSVAPGVIRCVAHLPIDMPPQEEQHRIASMLRTLIDRHGLTRYVLWYETPMFARPTEGLDPITSVYDCMDELAAFAWAPAELRAREAELLARVDLVFTGGQSLFERTRPLHPSVYAFPSSVDFGHFGTARSTLAEPRDQSAIPRPRLGYFGVVDERMDLGLLEHVAVARPDWHLVIVGPVVKIDPNALPERPNIHYLGMRPYDDLPVYIAGWDVAIMPFALNDATRYISPTKTLEYLAAGRPVVSTEIHDVVHPYGVEGLVSVAADPGAFVAATERALTSPSDRRMALVDAMLAQTSWERTWTAMDGLLDEVIRSRALVTSSAAAAT